MSMWKFKIQMFDFVPSCKFCAYESAAWIMCKTVWQFQEMKPNDWIENAQQVGLIEKSKKFICNFLLQDRTLYVLMSEAQIYSVFVWME